MLRARSQGVTGVLNTIGAIQTSTRNLSLSQMLDQEHKLFQEFLEMFRHLDHYAFEDGRRDGKSLLPEDVNISEALEDFHTTIHDPGYLLHDDSHANLARILGLDMLLVVAQNRTYELFDANSSQSSIENRESYHFNDDQQPLHELLEKGQPIVRLRGNHFTLYHTREQLNE